MAKINIMRKGLAIASVFLIIGVLFVAVVSETTLAKKPSRKRAPKECNDGIDNDGDGFTDYPADPGCRRKRDNSELNPNVQCDDGTDNDGDGLIDYPNDPGCTSPTDNNEYNAPAQQCNDGIDNDGDNLIDYPEDPGCESVSDNDEYNPLTECSDGIDNDGDSAIDLNDAGCASTSDDDETNCGDSICEGGETCSSCSADCGTCNSCADSDNGVVPEIQGYVVGFSNGNLYNITDTCLSNTVLVEQFCAGVYPFNTTINCDANLTTNCVNGACI